MLKMFDLFAGIGSFRLAFEKIMNADVVISSEIDRFCNLTYTQNFKVTNHKTDIYKVKSSDIPDFDLLTAGFPCQPYSIAGRRLGMSDVRADLFYEIARVLEDKKPKYFILENVKNLLNMGNGDVFKDMKFTLEYLGYKIKYKVLNAADFGSPSKRERLFIFGTTDEKVFDAFEFPTSNGEFHVLRDILEEEVAEKYTTSNANWNWLIKHKEVNKAKGSNFGYYLYDGSTQVGVLTTRYYKDGKEILIHQEGKNPRKLTPREAARLMGFPDSFKIVTSDTQAYRQFGNSIFVPVLEAIAETLKVAILP